MRATAGVPALKQCAVAFATYLGEPAIGGRRPVGAEAEAELGAFDRRRRAGHRKAPEEGGRVGDGHSGSLAASDRGTACGPADVKVERRRRPARTAEDEAVDDLEPFHVQRGEPPVPTEPQPMVIYEQRPEQSGCQDPAVVVMDL